MDGQFSIMIGNRSRFDAGDPSGYWLDMPATKEQLHEAMQSVGITADNPQDFSIRGYSDDPEKHIALPYSSLCRTYANHAAALPKWAIWVFSPGCFIVQSVAARCINAAQRTLPKNRSILSVRPIGKAKICVRPIPLKKSALLRRLFMSTAKKTSCARSLAPPFQITTAYAGL